MYLKNDDSDSEAPRDGTSSRAQSNMQSNVALRRRTYLPKTAMSGHLTAMGFTSLSVGN
jgi:hypothetical protein